MASYRFCFVAGDEHVTRTHDVDCGSDEDALDRARQLRHTHAIEIWQAERRVGRVDGSLRIELA